MKKKLNLSIKISKFQLALFLYFAVLLILSGLFLSYIKNTLIEFERSEPENYINYIIKNLSNKDLDKLIKNNKVKIDSLEISKKSSTAAYKKLIKGKLNIQKIEDNMYDVLIKDRKIFTITLKEKSKVQKLGLLNYNILETKDLISYLDRGIVYKDIYVPDYYKVIVNNQELTEKHLISSDKLLGLEDMYYYDAMPKINKYQINNLLEEPKVIIMNGQDEKMKFKNNTYIIDLKNSFPQYKDYTEALKDLSSEVDILNIAKQWSLFLTKDLTGGQYGFPTIQTNLIEGTNLYKTARDWAYGIDITFTSDHSFKTPPFSDEKITDCVIYDENAFSCKVYFKKNMIVKGRDKIDIINDYFYFIKYNGNWKLIKIIAAEE